MVRGGIGRFGSQLIRLVIVGMLCAVGSVVPAAAAGGEADLAVNVHAFPGSYVGGQSYTGTVEIINVGSSVSNPIAVNGAVASIDFPVSYPAGEASLSGCTGQGGADCTGITVKKGSSFGQLIVTLPNLPVNGRFLLELSGHMPEVKSSTTVSALATVTPPTGITDPVLPNTSASNVTVAPGPALAVTTVVTDTSGAQVRVLSQATRVIVTDTFTNNSAFTVLPRVQRFSATMESGSSFTLAEFRCEGACPDSLPSTPAKTAVNSVGSGNLYQDISVPALKPGESAKFIRVIDVDALTLARCRRPVNNWFRVGNDTSWTALDLTTDNWVGCPSFSARQTVEKGQTFLDVGVVNNQDRTPNLTQLQVTSGAPSPSAKTSWAINGYSCQDYNPDLRVCDSLTTQLDALVGTSGAGQILKQPLVIDSIPSGASFLIRFATTITPSSDPMLHFTCPTGLDQTFVTPHEFTLTSADANQINLKSTANLNPFIDATGKCPWVESKAVSPSSSASNLIYSGDPLTYSMTVHNPTAVDLINFKLSWSTFSGSIGYGLMGDWEWTCQLNGAAAADDLCPEKSTAPKDWFAPTVLSRVPAKSSLTVTITKPMRFAPTRGMVVFVPYEENVWTGGMAPIRFDNVVGIDAQAYVEQSTFTPEAGSATSFDATLTIGGEARSLPVSWTLPANHAFTANETDTVTCQAPAGLACPQWRRVTDASGAVKLSAVIEKPLNGQVWKFKLNGTAGVVDRQSGDVTFSADNTATDYSLRDNSSTRTIAITGTEVPMRVGYRLRLPAGKSLPSSLQLTGEMTCARQDGQSWSMSLPAGGSDVAAALSKNVWMGDDCTFTPTALPALPSGLKWVDAVPAAKTTKIGAAGGTVTFDLVAEEDVSTEDPAGSLTLTGEAVLNDGNGNDLANVGETIDYTFTLTNTGQQTISTLVLTTVNPNATTTRTSRAAALTPVCGADTLSAGESTTCQVKGYAVTQADINAGRAALTGTAKGVVASTGKDVEAGPTVLTVRAEQRTAIKLEMSANLADDNNDQLANPGERVIFTYVVTNTGTVPLSAADITSVLSETLRGGGEPLKVTCPATPLTVEQGSVTCTVVHVTTETEANAGMVWASAVAAADRAGQRISSDEANAQVKAGLKKTDPISPGGGTPTPEGPATPGTAQPAPGSNESPIVTPVANPARGLPATGSAGQQTSLVWLGLLPLIVLGIGAHRVRKQNKAR